MSGGGQLGSDGEQEDSIDADRKKGGAGAGRDHPMLQLWRHPESDALSLLRAMGAFAFSLDNPDFCREHLLHEKTMQQNHQLRAQVALSSLSAPAKDLTALSAFQLTRIANQVYSEEEDYQPLVVSRSMRPPSREEENLLRQIVAAGFVDSVARRMPPGDGRQLELQVDHKETAH